MMRRHSILVLMGGILVLLLAGRVNGDTVGSVPLRAAEGDTLRQGVPTLPPAAPAGGSGGPLTKPIPAAALPPAPTYEYNAAGKPDPFKPFIETDPVLKKKEEDLSKKAAGEGRPISPLQQMDIGQFRLVGIAGDREQVCGDCRGWGRKKYYPLFVGTYIGLNGGRVAAILPDRVIVEEQAEDPAEKRPKRRRSGV